MSTTFENLCTDLNQPAAIEWKVTEDSPWESLTRQRWGLRKAKQCVESLERAIAAGKAPKFAYRIVPGKPLNPPMTEEAKAKLRALAEQRKAEVTEPGEPLPLTRRQLAARKAVKTRQARQTANTAIVV